jgi:transposase InsO family protein
LLKLGLPIARSTIQRYLKGRRAAGPGSQTWRTFLHNHASSIWACDFLQLHDIWFRDLFVVVIIELSSRRVVYVAVTRHPSEVWVAQQLREATPFGEAPRFLIRDNDRKYGTAFDRVASGAGIEVLHTPVAAPRANAYCERFLGSLRRECLDCLFIVCVHGGSKRWPQWCRIAGMSHPQRPLVESLSEAEWAALPAKVQA